MNRDDVLGKLRKHLVELRDRFGVQSLSLFGSASRDQLRPGSDIDVLVQFREPATFDGYFALKFYLEEPLGCTVDLATEKMIKPRFRRLIQDELLHVA